MYCLQMKRLGNVHTNTWTKAEVVAFLQHAYSKFEYRNVGVISQIIYELQPPRLEYKDIFKWTWSDVDNEWDAGLLHTLEQQRNDFGFQDYIAPQIRPIKGEYVPYTKFRFSKVARRIINDTPTLRKDLRMRYLPLS
jgi:hypothetical protein